MDEGKSPQEMFTVRTIGIPDPNFYRAAQIRRLRDPSSPNDSELFHPDARSETVNVGPLIQHYLGGQERNRVSPVELICKTFEAIAFCFEETGFSFEEIVSSLEFIAVSSKRMAFPSTGLAISSKQLPTSSKRLSISSNVLSGFSGANGDFSIENADCGVTDPLHL